MELPTQRGDYSKWKEDPETGEVIQVHTSEGAEIPDPVPMAPPLGYDKPLSMFDQHRAMIRAEHHRLRQMELDQLQESVEEANDFDVEDDVENMPSLFEEKFDPVDYEVRQRLRQADHRARVEAAVDKLPPQQKELLNGDNLNRQSEVPGGVQRGREAGGGAGVRESAAQSEDDRNPVQDASNSGNVSEGNRQGGGGRK